MVCINIYYVLHLSWTHTHTCSSSAPHIEFPSAHHISHTLPPLFSHICTIHSNFATTEEPQCCTEYLHRGSTRSGVITTATGVGSPDFSSTQFHHSLFGMYAFMAVTSAIEGMEDNAFIGIKGSELIYCQLYCQTR